MSERAMEAQLKRNLLFVSAVVLFATTMVSAQSRVKIEIPFPFSVGQAEQPAGVWLVSQSVSNPHLQMFSRIGGTEQFMVMSLPLEGIQKLGPAHAEFNRYGGQHFLAGIWRSGAKGVSFAPGKVERELIEASMKTDKLTVIAGTK